MQDAAWAAMRERQLSAWYKQTCKVVAASPQPHWLKRGSHYPNLLKSIIYNVMCIAECKIVLDAGQ